MHVKHVIIDDFVKINDIMPTIHPWNTTAFQRKGLLQYML